MMVTRAETRSSPWSGEGRTKCQERRQKGGERKEERWRGPTEQTKTRWEKDVSFSRKEQGVHVEEKATISWRDQLYLKGVNKSGNGGVCCRWEDKHLE